MKEKIFLTRVVLGNPRFNCDRHGICKIEENPPPYFKSKLARDNIVWVQMIHLNGVLQCTFLKESINKNTFDKHFAKGYFKIEYSKIISQNLGLLLNINTPSVLSQGIYPINLNFYDDIEVNIRVAQQCESTLLDNAKIYCTCLLNKKMSN